MMWHSMNEELPPKPSRYLIYFLYQDVVRISYWDGESWDLKGCLSITHWMELPEKPENAVAVAFSNGGLISDPRER